MALFLERLLDRLTGISRATGALVAAWLRAIRVRRFPPPLAVEGQTIREPFGANIVCEEHNHDTAPD